MAGAGAGQLHIRKWQMNDGRQTMTPRKPPISEQDMAREEAGISRIAWAGGAAVAVVTGATLVVLLSTTAAAWWRYAVYAVLAAVPLAYALFSNTVVRRMQIALYRRYQEQLMYQLTDLQEMAYRDELTGLYNRRHFQEVMHMEVEKVHVTKQPLALMLLDLDELKKINDEYGHGVGDVILARLGAAIARHTRVNDVASRLGGDEFGVVMPATDKRGAFALARRLWEDLERTPIQLSDGRNVMVTVSIGLAGFPWGGETVEEMIQWADADMYANKVSRKLALETVFSRRPRDTGPAEEEYFEGN